MQEFSKLSNTLLDLSRYDTQVKIEYKPVNININQLVRSTIEKIERLAIAKEINFEVKMIDSTIIIKGNEVELRRVLYNILDNAIKYIPLPGGKIVISDKISLSDYIITISDNGVGIPKNIIHKIFDPFFRGNVSRTANGAGLGLTLVKKIIENHKGTIVVKSEEKKGTNVIISLPISSQ
jgi:signal transduction histidine kinase